MNDELQLLREFRADVAEPDEEMALRIYAYATKPQRGWRDSPRSFLGIMQPKGYLVIAVTLALTSAMIVGFGTLAGHNTPGNKTGSNAGAPIGPVGGMPTMAQPLSSSAKQVPLASASSALGTSVTLPDSATVKPSDVGAVWEASASGPDGEHSVSVAVTFPSQGLIVRYSRPPIPDPLANYQSFVNDSPGSQVISLNGGVPALAIAQLPDGSNWGSIEFVAGGTTIAVLGHDGQATLQDVGQSILNRITSS